MNVRDWIYVDDHNAGLLAVAERGTPGEVYNLGSQNEWPNIEIVKTILIHLDRPESLIRYVKDRPGHDRRYAIDPTKTKRELGWTAQTNFAQGLPATIEWYLANQPWWERVMSGEYMKYYEKNYAPKM